MCGSDRPSKWSWFFRELTIWSSCARGTTKQRRRNQVSRCNSRCPSSIPRPCPLGEAVESEPLPACAWSGEVDQGTAVEEVGFAVKPSHALVRSDRAQLGVKRHPPGPAPFFPAVMMRAGGQERRIDVAQSHLPRALVLGPAARVIVPSIFHEREVVGHASHELVEREPLVLLAYALHSVIASVMGGEATVESCESLRRPTEFVGPLANPSLRPRRTEAREMFGAVPSKPLVLNDVLRPDTEVFPVLVRHRAIEMSLPRRARLRSRERSQDDGP